MVTEKLTTEDVLNLIEGKIVMQLPDYHACNSAKSMLTYVRNAYRDRIASGMVLTGSIDAESNILTVEYISEKTLSMRKSKSAE